MYRRFIFIFLILFMYGCGGKMNIRHEVVQPDGANFPDPYYVLQTVGSEKPIRISFFYSEIIPVKDLDGRSVPQNHYLDRRQHHLFFRSELQSVRLVARVLNPRNVIYKVYVNQDIEFSDGGSMDSYHMVGMSDMRYREFNRELPVWDGVKETTYSFEIRDHEDNLLITTGKFHYYIQ